MTKLKKGKFEFPGVTFTVSDGGVRIDMGAASAVITHADLWGMAFAISDGEMKDKIMPVRKDEMMRFKKVHSIRLERDMKAGEILTTSCVVDVPERIVEGYKHLIEGNPLTYKNTGAILSPLQAGNNLPPSSAGNKKDVK